jgi:hypothetical protein
MNDQQQWVAFVATSRIVAGEPATVAASVKQRQAQADNESVLVFDRADGRVVDLDLRGTESEVAARYSSPLSGPVPAASRDRGRPKLGVTSREVTLLPRHWDWLAEQQGGASGTLRRLVDAAIKERKSVDHVRRATEAAYRFMSALAGDLQEFEEASRALFASDRVGFEARTSEWPDDVRAELGRFVELAFGNGETQP